MNNQFNEQGYLTQSTVTNDQGTERHGYFVRAEDGKTLEERHQEGFLTRFTYYPNGGLQTVEFAPEDGNYKQFDTFHYSKINGQYVVLVDASRLDSEAPVQESTIIEFYEVAFLPRCNAPPGVL